MLTPCKIYIVKYKLKLHCQGYNNAVFDNCNNKFGQNEKITTTVGVHKVKSLSRCRVSEFGAKCSAGGLVGFSHKDAHLAGTMTTW